MRAGHTNVHEMGGWVQECGGCRTPKNMVDQINEYKVFVDHGRAKYDPKSKRITNASQGYQKIKVHLVFACKHNRCHKVRLVAGSYLTPDPIDSLYAGVVSTRSLRLSIFLSKLSNMKVWAAHKGNAYLEATSKEGETIYSRWC